MSRPEAVSVRLSGRLGEEARVEAELVAARGPGERPRRPIEPPIIGLDECFGVKFDSADRRSVDERLQRRVGFGATFTWGPPFDAVNRAPDGLEVARIVGRVGGNAPEDLFDHRHAAEDMVDVV